MGKPGRYPAPFVLPILDMANWIAESRYCFIEADITTVDDPDRSW
jgi:hypothetical protein